jgi:thiamine-phosphate pyrophosphorylase
VFVLYLITEGAAGLPVSVGRALSAAPVGSVAVQLRAKQAGSCELLEVARALRAITRRHASALIINDRIDIAQLAEADGVHLPENGLPLAAARRLLGPSALIGMSCHDARGLAQARRSGADFATLSPVFASPGKGEPLGIERFAELARPVGLPVYALGGVRAEYAPQLKAAGAAGLAVISAVFSAPDPSQATAELVQTWNRAAGPNRVPPSRA